MPVPYFTAQLSLDGAHGGRGSEAAQHQGEIPEPGREAWTQGAARRVLAGRGPGPACPRGRVGTARSPSRAPPRHLLTPPPYPGSRQGMAPPGVLAGAGGQGRGGPPQRDAGDSLPVRKQQPHSRCPLATPGPALWLPSQLPHTLSSQKGPPNPAKLRWDEPSPKQSPRQWAQSCSCGTWLSPPLSISVFPSVSGATRPTRG